MKMKITLTTKSERWVKVIEWIVILWNEDEHEYDTYEEK